MAHLAGTEPDRPISLGSIAEAEGLPLAYLEHLVQRLRRQGLVESRRGAHGGYTLSRPATEITMAEIVSALGGHPPPIECTTPGGHLAPIECITPEGMCSREVKGDSPCPTKLLWTRVQGSIVRTLTDMTLEDLTPKKEQQAA